MKDEGRDDDDKGGATRWSTKTSERMVRQSRQRPRQSARQFRGGDHEQDKDQEVGGKGGTSGGWSRNAVPRPVFIDDFEHSTRNASRTGAYQAVTARGAAGVCTLISANLLLLQS